VRKSARLAWQLRVPILGLVENLSYAICPQCGEKIEVFGPSWGVRTALQLDVPFLGRLPLDPDLARRCDAGEIEGYAAEAFAPIAGQVLNRVAGIQG